MLWLDSARHDIRYACRLIRKSPLLSVATIVTLALGIGLDAGVFTVVNGMLFREDLASRFLPLVEIVVFLGGVAILLAVIGIYAVVAFAVNRRAKEMGIRVALGATRKDIIRLVLSSGTKPIAAGVGGGVALALLASQAVTQIFSNTPVRLDPRDPLAYGIVTILLMATAIAAMFGPALRAASADPAHALRQD